LPASPCFFLSKSGKAESAGGRNFSKLALKNANVTTRTVAHTNARTGNNC